MKRDIAQTITDQIIEAIESGQASGQWETPWDTTAGLPSNAFDRRTYNGINTLVLWTARAQHGYTSNQWATFKRWQSEGYRLENAKGRGVHVVFWKWLERENDTGDVERFPLLRSFVVFNADHAVNAETGEPFTDATTPAIDGDDVPEGWEPASELIANSGAQITYGSNRAFYTPSIDAVVMPSLEAFNSAEAFYSTAFHELAHWTGHESRLGRKLANRFGSEAYAVEELIAELSAAFTCAHVRLSAQPRPDHAEYIASWLKVLRNDKTAILKASAEAFKATQYIINQGQPEPQALAG